MDPHQLSQIQPKGDPIPIILRVIRKWSPYRMKKDIAYLLIDQQGDAIQANVHHLDYEHFKDRLEIMSCYSFDNYICSRASKTLAITNHPAVLILGRNIIINQVPTPERFPEHYFNLLTYEEVTKRINNKDIVSDYAGRLDNTKRVTTADGTKLLRMRMTDISGEKIEATIWEEIIPRFDWEKMSQADPPIIAAITSTRVTTFNSKTKILKTLYKAFIHLTNNMHLINRKDTTRIHRSNIYLL